MVLNESKSACAVLDIFLESARVIIDSMECEADKTEMFKSNLAETIGRLQDVLDNTTEKEN